jgi:hypothetical protein
MEMERTMQQMQQLLANQEKVEADRIANRECMKQTNAEMKADQEDLKSMMVEMNAKLDVSHKMMAMLDAHRERTVASLGKKEATDFKAIPEEIESVTEHQETPKEDAAVMPVGGPRKWRRVRNLAAER